MSLYAIGDLHLHFQSELKAPGQLHEPVWKDHEAKLRKNIEEIITEDGTMWTANEVYIPHTMLTQEEIEAQFDSYFKIEEPEATIEDLTEALDILTSIVLGE